MPYNSYYEAFNKLNKDKKEVAKYFTILGIAIVFCIGGVFIICLQYFTM